MNWRMYMTEEDKKYAYWLNSLPGIGSKAIGKLLDAFQNPYQIYQKCKTKGSGVWYNELLTEGQAQKAVDFTKSWSLEEEYKKLIKGGVRFLCRGEPDYPKRLMMIPDSPYGLFVKGGIPDDKILSVAIIGARQCSEYGSYVAKELGKLMGQMGIQVISGMARGIDGISQNAALEADGASYAVLGCGVDICYPSSNRNIYHKLLDKGGILSLYPPGTKPQAGLFPPRNRIVSGLADAVVVVEARQKSGTLITVDMALEQGREVYAVPGRLTDRLSDGCNKLIKQGAGVILSPQDFVMDLLHQFPNKKLSARVVNEEVTKKIETTIDADKMKSSGKSKRSQLENERGIIKVTSETNQGMNISNREHLSPEEQSLWACLDLYPLSVESIREKWNPQESYQNTLRELIQLCMKEVATQVSSGYFAKKME